VRADGKLAFRRARNRKAAPSLLNCSWRTNRKVVIIHSLGGQTRVYVSAIAEFSAIAAWALSFKALKPNPLKNVREAVP